LQLIPTVTTPFPLMLPNWCRVVQLPVISTICCRTRGFLRERRLESARVPSSCH